MVGLFILGCVFLPLLSLVVVEPYIVSTYGTFGQDISMSDMWVVSILAIIVIAVLFAGITTKQTVKKGTIYLSGVGRDDATRSFQNSLSGTTEATARNWYMEPIFGEKRIAPIGVVFNTVIMVVAFVYAFIATL
jgi:ech hydrogenase subunit A